MSGRKVNCPLGSVGHGCPRNMSARISVSVPVKSGTSDAGSVVLKKYRSCTVGPVGGHSCPGAAQCTPRGGKGGTSTLKHVHPWSLSCFGLRPPAWLAAATGNANATAATSGIMNRRIRVSPLAAYGRKYSPPKAAAVSTRRPDGLTGQGLRDESAWSPHFEVGDRGCGPLLIAAPAQSLHRRRLRPHRENSPCCAFRLPIFGDEPQLEGRSAGLAPGVGVELAKHRGDVVVDRLRRDGQTVCDLAFRRPAAASSSTSSSRGVRLAGLRRVATRGPRGRPRTPRSRRRRATMLAAGRAPSRCSSSSARQTTSSSSASARARAASYGQSSLVQSSAAHAQSPAIWTAYGSAASGGISSRIPARRRQYASSPITQEACRRTA